MPRSGFTFGQRHSIFFSVVNTPQALLRNLMIPSVNLLIHSLIKRGHLLCSNPVLGTRITKVSKV